MRNLNLNKFDIELTEQIGDIIVEMAQNLNLEKQLKDSHEFVSPSDDYFRDTF